MNTPPTPNINVLFYSNKCRDCQDLLQLLNNEHLLSHFKLFCVDNNLHNVPKGITRVPTMIVVGVKQLLIAKEAFDWVQKIKFFKQQQSENNIAQQKDSMILGYFPQEMSGISDQFAAADATINIPYSKNYMSVKAQDCIFTAPQEEDKLTKDDQRKRIKEIDNMRKEQEKLFDDNNKKIHQSILNAKKR